MDRDVATDAFRAVQARRAESVVFSWIEPSDKTSRDAGVKKPMESDPMDPATNPPPFDSKRMIFGGLAPVLEL